MAMLRNDEMDILSGAMPTIISMISYDIYHPCYLAS